MSRRAAGLGLVASASAILAACKSEAGPAPAPGHVVGRVTGEDGRPLAGAQITATYQSYGGGRAMRYGASHSRTATTDASGAYRIRIDDMAPGEYSISAHGPVRADGATQQWPLVANDAANIDNRSASVRNFSWKVVEQSADNPYGNGGIFVVETAIGNYSDLSEAEVTLWPLTGGRTIVGQVRRTGEGLVVTGVPPGRYRASVKLGGRTLQINRGGMDDPNDPFVPSIEGSITGGASGNIFRVRAKGP
jgi:hypothetical protein